VLVVPSDGMGADDGAGLLRQSVRPRAASYIGITATPRNIRSWLRLMLTAMDDPIIQRIECFRCSRGTLHAERRNRGYALYRARSGALVARLRPTGSDDRFEVLYL
jgi:hypothetical protein